MGYHAKENKLLRKPPWLKMRGFAGRDYFDIKRRLRNHALHTVCQEARCPNARQCWSQRTATFMILGDICTRNCRFCAVKSGNPSGYTDAEEPRRLAEMIKEIGLRYAVITSVTRDDLADGGARHYVECVSEIKLRVPGIVVELLIPDLGGKLEAIALIAQSKAEVIGHNLETVRELSRKVRDRHTSYQRSLEVLRYLKQVNQNILTKSALLLGLGEGDHQIRQAMSDLIEAKVDILALGQYLQPTRQHLAPYRYLTPQEFDRYREIGLSMGFRFVASAPMVRSSYRAAEFYARYILEEKG